MDSRARWEHQGWKTRLSSDKSWRLAFEEQRYSNFQTLDTKACILTEGVLTKFIGLSKGIIEVIECRVKRLWSALLFTTPGMSYSSSPSSRV